MHTLETLLVHPNSLLLDLVTPASQIRLPTLCKLSVFFCIFVVELVNVLVKVFLHWLHFVVKWFPWHLPARWRELHRHCLTEDAAQTFN